MGLILLLGGLWFPQTWAYVGIPQIQRIYPITKTVVVSSVPLSRSLICDIPIRRRNNPFPLHVIISILYPPFSLDFIQPEDCSNALQLPSIGERRLVYSATDVARLGNDVMRWSQKSSKLLVQTLKMLVHFHWA